MSISEKLQEIILDGTIESVRVRFVSGKWLGTPNFTSKTLKPKDSHYSYEWKVKDIQLIALALEHGEVEIKKYQRVNTDE